MFRNAILLVMLIHTNDFKLLK